MPATQNSHCRFAVDLLALTEAVQAEGDGPLRMSIPLLPQGAAESLIEHFGLRSGGEIWYCNLGGGVFGAVTLFCWKYLKAEEIDTWVESILAIRSSHFRAQWLAWLVGAYRLITGSIATFTDLDRQCSQLQWENSHVLKRHFESEEAQPIPLVDEPNRAAFALALRSRLTESLVLEWIEGFSRFDYLEESLGWLPDQLIAQYFSRIPGDPFYTPN